jgi:PAS domain S-box-containing protein
VLRLSDIAESSTGLRRFVAAVGILVIACVWASVGYDVWTNHRSIVAGCERELTNISQVLSEQASRSLQATDLILRDTARWYGSVEARTATSEDIDEFLRSRIGGVPQVRSLNVLDANGGLLHWSADTRVPDASLADKQAFEALRDAADGALYLGPPVRSATDKRMGFDMARRLSGRGGRFEGVLLARVESAYYEDFYKAIALGSDSTIALFRTDGTLLARHPDDEARIGVRVPQSLAPLDLLPDGPVVMRAASPFDGKDRFRALTRVRGLPLVVLVAREADSVLRPWWTATINSLFRALAMSAIVAVLTTALLRELRRRDGAMAALRRSEERYQLVLRGSNEGYWDWNLGDDSIDISRRLKELHGVPPEQRFATRAQWRTGNNVHPDDRNHFEAALERHLHGGSPRFEVEYRVRTPSGERWLHMRGLAFRDEKGGPYRLSGSVSDISDRKRAEEDRAKLEAQLRRSQKMEAMGTLAGGIAHDFNNILGAILGYGEMAQRAAGPNQTLQRYLDNVMNAAARARTLVERILAFSRSGMGRRVPFHIQSAVEEALDLLQASVPTRIRLVRQLEAGDARVIGDATGVHQIVMNLCTNAMQAIEGSGTITIGLEREKVERSRQLQSGTLGVGDYVRLSVADTGSGIDPHVLDLVFDPFFTTKPVGEGTGLGLSLVHGIVTELGGAIDVTTKPGAGACFRVYLPYSGEIERRPAPAARELERGNGETVLLVDDEPALVSLNEELLAELGYEPVGFTSSLDALRAFRAQPDRFDVVFTDETMPDMVGTEFARAVMDLRADIPVVLMSGYSGPKLARRAEEVGIREVLKKPLRLEDVAGALAAILTGPHSTARRAQDG